MNKKSKIFIIRFFSLILIPVIVIGIINHTKEQELNDRIENGRETKTLSLNNISSSITLDELLEIEMSNEYNIEDNELKYDNDSTKKDFTVEYTNTSFYGSHCIMEYYFVDEKLKRCIFTIDTSHWQPKDIYEELSKINGIPDETKIDDDSFYLETYTWYGKNGTITYNKLNNNTIEVFFEILN